MISSAAEVALAEAEEILIQGLVLAPAGLADAGSPLPDSEEIFAVILAYDPLEISSLIPMVSIGLESARARCRARGNEVSFWQPAEGELFDEPSLSLETPRLVALSDPLNVDGAFPWELYEVTRAMWQRVVRRSSTPIRSGPLSERLAEDFRCLAVDLNLEDFDEAMRAAG